MCRMTWAPYFKVLKKSNFSIVNFSLLLYCKGTIRYILFPMRLPCLHAVQISYVHFYCITIHKPTHKLLVHSWVSSWIQMTPFPTWYTTKYYYVTPHNYYHVWICKCSVRRIDSLWKDSWTHTLAFICVCIYVC